VSEGDFVGKLQETLFIFGDGDRVRERIEGLLFSNDLEALSKFSSSLSNAILLLAKRFSENMEAQVLMSAGDDLLVRLPKENYSRHELEDLASLYRDQIGSSISFGVGPSIESAYLNLRRAKSSNTQKIVETGVTP
jgi:hypothetical protein